MAFLDSIKRFVIPSAEEYEDENVSAKKEEKRTSYDSRPSSYSEDITAPGIKKARVVNINAGVVQKIVIVKLDSCFGAQVIIDNLKQKTSVVFNIARLDRVDAGRVVDVVYGAAHALDGSMQKVSSDIFVVTPYGMEITGDITERLRGSNEFSWDV